MKGWRELFSRKGGIALADRARDSGDWKTAATLYREVLEDDSSLAPIWVQYGHALKEAGNVNAAIEAYQRALALDDQQADFHLQLGHALKLAGQRLAAESAYLRAVKLAPDSPHSWLELAAMGWTANDIRRTISDQGQSKSSLIAEEVSPNSFTVIFDVSDLLGYFVNARLPTGIQRVQINVIKSALAGGGDSIRIVSFSVASDNWVEVSRQLFLRLAELAIASGDLNEPSWRAAMTDLRYELELGMPFEFPFGAALVNLGTSWWLKNYFLMVREAKNSRDIKYIPFVHDLIPVFTPEHCTPELTKDFISWLLGVFQHADGYLVNSKATAIDLARVAKQLGHSPPSPAVIYLDGDCRVESDDLRAKRKSSAAPSLTRLGLEDVPYVLFVSTIESRKNHLMAFNTWLRLLKQRGVRNTPALICVGNPGWMVGAALARLDSSTLLKQRVFILSKISDEELALLYRNSLFTLYPSSYEGWGLPVTEALCYGKIPLISRVSSLPEAGGGFAEYFDPESEADLAEKITRLLDDSAYRRRLEERIQSEFQPRSWGAISEQLLGEVKSLCERSAASTEQTGYVQRGNELPFAVHLGRYYALSSNEELSVYHGMVSGEMFRIGAGWHAPDAWGSWIRKSTAALRFRLPRQSSARHTIYISLLGLPASSGKAVRVQVHIGERAKSMDVTLGPGEKRWVRMSLSEQMVGSDEAVQLTFVSDASVGLADVTNGIDVREVWMGVIGFYIAEEGDIAQRLALLEAIQFGCFDSLVGRSVDYETNN